MIDKYLLQERVDRIEELAYNHLGERIGHMALRLTRPVSDFAYSEGQSFAEEWVDTLFDWIDEHCTERQMDVFGAIWNTSRIGKLIYALSSPCGWRGVKCRWQGHPHNVAWYNASGFEPDMSCRNCGEDVG